MHQHLSYRISLCAKTHRPLAITAIVISKVALAVIGFGFGVSAWFEGIALPQQKTEWLLVAVAAVCVLAYPGKHLKKRLSRSAFYWRQKSMDGALAAFGFAFFFFAGNMTPSWVAQPESLSVNNVSGITIAVSSLEKPVSERRAGVAQGGKLRHWVVQKAKSKLARMVTKIERMSDGDNTGGKIALSVLMVLLAVALGYLVLVLACSLSCNGQAGLAVLVSVGGVALLVVALIFGFRAIWRKDKNYKK